MAVLIHEAGPETCLGTLASIWLKGVDPIPKSIKHQVDIHPAENRSQIPMTLRLAVCLALLATLITVTCLCASAQFQDPQWKTSLEYWQPPSVHDLSLHLKDRPAYNVTALPYIKLLHQPTAQTRPVWNIYNRSIVAPVRQLKVRQPQLIEIGSGKNRTVIDLMSNRTALPGAGAVT